MNQIYPKQKHSHKILGLLAHKPIVYTIFSPLYILLFLISILLMIGLTPWLIYKMFHGLIYGDPISFSGALYTILFLAVFILVIGYFFLIPYRIFSIYKDDVVMIGLSNDSLVLRKWLDNIEFKFDQIKSIRTELEKDDRYYGQFHEVFITTTDGSEHNFVFTVSMKFAGLPIWIPSQSKREAFENFMEILDSSELSERLS